MSGKSEKSVPSVPVAPVSASRKPLVKEVEKLDKQLAALQGELKLLETRLADPALYAAGDKKLLTELGQRQSTLVSRIHSTEARWLEVQELLEQG
jgi:ATP-binding cassette subfamily F protein 3